MFLESYCGRYVIFCDRFLIVVVIIIIINWVLVRRLLVVTETITGRKIVHSYFLTDRKVSF